MQKFSGEGVTPSPDPSHSAPTAPRSSRRGLWRSSSTWHPSKKNPSYGLASMCPCLLTYVDAPNTDKWPIVQLMRRCSSQSHDGRCCRFRAVITEITQRSTQQHHTAVCRVRSFNAAGTEAGLAVSHDDWRRNVWACAAPSPGIKVSKRGFV